MPALQEQLKYAEEYPQKVKEAKMAKRITNQELADLSGVSPSAVNKLLAGSQVDPRLFNSAALCQVLDLSLDELFGLKPEQTEGTLRARVRELELENARLSALVESSAGQARMNRAAAFSLVALCSLLTIALIVYLAVDSTIHDAGLIRFGNPTFAGWVLIALVVISVLVTVTLVVRVSLKGKVKQREDTNS